MTEEYQDVPFPFDVDFQKKLLKVLMVRDFAGSKIIPHLQAKYFSTPELRWAMGTIKQYYDAYSGVPTWEALEYHAKQSPEGPTLGIQLNNIRQMEVHDANWLRDNVVGWIKHNLYLRSLRAAIACAKKNKIDESLFMMDEALTQVNNVEWEQDNQCFFFEELEERQKERLEARQQPQGTIGTGIDELDDALGGGISKGELGVFMGYAKSGKSIFLMNLAANACKAYGTRVYHTNYEINQYTLKMRYDSWFSGEAFNRIRDKGLSSKAVKELKEMYSDMKDLLIIKGQDRFSGSNPNYKTVEGLIEDLRELESKRAWRPDLIIVDYADLMRTKTQYNNIYQKATEVYRALHDLALEGYAIWTVSQANERDKDRNEKHLLKSGQITESQEKFRAADIYGSINVTPEEKENGEARLYLENARAHGKFGVIEVKTDLAKMRFGVGVESKPLLDPSKAINRGDDNETKVGTK